MKRLLPLSLLWIAGLCLSSLCGKVTAADVLTPCFLKVSIYTNLTGAAVADFTGDANYPAKPGEVRFLRSFNTRDAMPTDALEDFGGRIEGFLTPLESGQYTFFLRSDSQSQLFLSTDDKEANAAQIAEEQDRGDPFLEPDAGDTATSTPIALVAGKRYFIMVLYKGNSGGGNSTDFAQVAWRKSGDTTPALSLKPIPAAFLSTLADDSKASKITITQQPKDVTGEENSQVTFSIVASNAPASPICVQWQRNGVSIPGATGTNYTRFLDKADNGVKFRAVVAVPGASVNSAEVTATVTEDKTRPTLLTATGGHNRPEVTLTFSERVNATTATTAANYKITGSAGATLAVNEATLSADRTQVTLKTAAQTAGTQYTVTVNNVTDLAAATPNAVAANTSATFYALGPLLQGDDGFVVWEAEDFDRNLDGLWFVETERGAASGGMSVVNYNGAGGGENATKLEYDILFTKTGRHIIWGRASANDGNDDSVWVHLDGERPVERAASNDAALTGFGSSLNATYAWGTGVQGGVAPMTFEIKTAGLHTIGIGRREDGTYVDKFVITTDPGFNPTTVFGAFGPPVSLRQGEPPPPPPKFDFVTHPASTNVLENTSLTLTVTASIPQGVLFSYQWQRKEGNSFADISGAGGTSYTINPVTLSVNGTILRVRLIVAGITKYSNEATITVTPETIVPELIRATGSSLKSTAVVVFSEPVTAATAQNKANYKIDGPAGSVAVQSATLFPNGRTVVLETGPQTVGTKYTVTVNGVNDTAAKPNVVSNGQAKFYSVGQLQPQWADGLLVFEAEDFDRNQGDLWTVDRLRGTPSGGASVVVPTGADNDANRVEFDLTFTKTGNHVIWFRGTGNSGSDDSGWLILDGARPPNRTTGSLAAMTGFPTGTQADFGWATSVQGGPAPMSFEITQAGVHTIGLGVREDGAFFDKFAISSDTNFNANSYGTFGPPETRAGVPTLPTIAITAPTANAQFDAGVDIPFTVDISATTRVISKVEFFRGNAKIGESGASPFNFTWQNAPTGTNNITARLTDDVRDSVSSRAVAVIVNPGAGGTPPKFTSFRVQGGNLVLEWTGASRLQSSPALPGQWADVANAASPFTVAPSGPQRFYRLAQ